MLRLGLAMITNRPGMFLETFLPTVEHIKQLVLYSTFLIHFQEPWNEELISKALEGLNGIGFEVKWKMTGVWSKPLELIRMREEFLRLDPEKDVYMLLDDDFKFSPGTKTQKKSSGEKYLHVLDYMERFPKCGLVNVKHFLGGAGYGDRISPSWHDYYAINRGLFIRRIPGFLIAPEHCLSIRAGLEESVFAFERISRGYFPAKQMNNPTIHIGGRVDSDNVPADSMHSPEAIANGCQKYIRDRYWDPSWIYSKRLPYGVEPLYSRYGGIDKNKLLSSSDYIVEY